MKTGTKRNRAGSDVAASALTVALTLAVWPSPAAGQDLEARIETAVKAHAEETLEIRHRIHRNPELGNREFETAALVADHLRELGMEVRTGIAHTGVVGVLRGGQPGPVVAVRADMDALPVTENTPYEFASEVRTEWLGQEVGVSHACGHDVHTAVQLGVASVLADLRPDLPGTVLFVFQPAEEGPPPGEEGGSELMLDEGVFDDPRPVAVFGLHTFSDMDVGTVGYTPGPALAAVDHFGIDILGRQAHGAAPHLSVDPVVVASEVILALQTIRSRSLDPLAPSVVTVGIVRGGQRFNIIPSEVHLEGTVRTYDPDIRDAVERRMDEIVAGVTQAYGAGYELDYDRGTPATVNDRELTATMVPTVERVIGEDNVLEIPPTMGGEDFALFANEVPGFFYRLGSRDPERGSGGHHTPEFMADDASVPVGMRVMANLLVDFLQSGAASADRRAEH